MAIGQPDALGMMCGGRSKKPFWQQAVIGVALAFLIIAAWLSLHFAAIFFFDLSRYWPLAPFVVALQCWLYVGLFIIAHDCMHGSLVPFQPMANRAIGSTVLFLYAGFPFSAMARKHHAHHRHAGTDADPDFDDRHPPGFWRWYTKFFAEYLTWRQPVVIGSGITLYATVFDAKVVNLVVFWAIPALLSSLQLFTFGTYLPHRPDAVGFADRHNARTNDYSWLVSLLTCFHFGYHHEHHLSPATPWWKLPEARRAERGRALPAVAQTAET